jgi:hypothetical protein
MASFAQVDMFGDRKTLRQFKNLERNVQRRVLRPLTQNVAKKTVQPILQRELPSRSFDPPTRLSYNGIPGPSHTGPPGVMRNNLKVKAIKRTRKTVGRVVMLPVREVLGVPDSSKAFYYPAAIEYGVSFNKLIGRPQPAKRIMRTLYQRHNAAVQSAVQKEARAAMKALAKR